MGTNHGGVGRRETGNNAIRRRRLVHNENRRPRYNYRIPYSPTARGHPTNLPYPSLTIAIERTGPNIRHREQRKGQEKDRMGPSGIPSSSSITEVKRDEPSPRKMGRYPRRRINRSQERRAGFYGYPTKTDQSGVHNIGLNPSHPERERDQVLLPPLKRGRQ